MTEAGDLRRIDVVALGTGFEVSDEVGGELVAVIVVPLVVTADGIVEILLMDYGEVLEGERHHHVHVLERVVVLSFVLRGGVVREDAHCRTVCRVDDVVGVHSLGVFRSGIFLELSRHGVAKGHRYVRVPEPGDIALHGEAWHQGEVIVRFGPGSAVMGTVLRKD